MTITTADLATFITYGAHGLPREDLPALREALQTERRRLLAGRHDPKHRFPLSHIERINVVIAEIDYTLDPCESTATSLRVEACRMANGILDLAAARSTVTP